MIEAYWNILLRWRQRLLLTERRERRSSSLITRVLNDEVGLGSVVVENGGAIRCLDGEGKSDRSTLLAKEDAERKVFSGLKSVGSGRRLAKRGVCSCVASVPAALGLCSEPQEDNVVGV